MSRLRFLADERGGAAVEMALMVPLLIVLLFGALESGHFVWTQHKLAEAVRDGARYASRMQTDLVCPASGTMSDELRDDIKLVTRTGQLKNPSAISKVPGWTDAQIEIDCGTFVDTGIYADYGKAGAVIRVSATDVPYPSLFNSLGIIGGAFKLSAKSNAPVIGI